MKRVVALVMSVCVVMAGASLVLAAPAGQVKPLTNADIVALAKAGMGDAVIIAKIQQAAAANFKLEVADLKTLKSSGVSDAVISEMLKKDTASSEPAPAPAPSRPAPAATAPPGATVGGYTDFGVVTMVLKGGKSVSLRSVAGTISTTFAYVTTLVHCNYDGLKADVRTSDRRPTFVVRSSKSPKGRLYLVTAEIDTPNNVRSVKMGNSRLFGSKNIGAPDSSNQIEYDVVAEGPDTWRMTPKKDLAPGEYGLWLQGNEMFDFGIDG